MSRPEKWLQSCNRTMTRVRPRKGRVALGMLSVAMFAATLALAQGAPRPEQHIKWRQSAYQVIAWNSARLKSALAGKYDAREVQAAANALASVAGSGLPGLFPIGTERGKGWRETTAKASVFTDAAAFRLANDEFSREAAALAQLAATADQKAVNDQFLKVAKTCKSCHEKFRQTD